MILRQTIFSPCRRYRYCLWRDWTDLLIGEQGYAQFIGLNPSTADETEDDPTIRRCIQFAKDFGCSALCMTNLFAWRDTRPDDMRKAAEPIGTDNDRWLLEVAANAKIIIAAWGNNGQHRGRSNDVRRLLGKHPLSYLKLNEETAEPAHPLYLSGALRPLPLL